MAGDAPLLVAIKKHKENIATALIQRGAPLGARNNAGESVFQAAYSRAMKRVVADAILAFRPFDAVGQLSEDAAAVWVSILSETGDEFIDDLRTLLKDLGPRLPQLLTLLDSQAKSALGVATPKYRALLLQHAYFCGKFDFVSGPICHESKSGSMICLAHSCLDSSRPLVALKFVGVDSRERKLLDQLTPLSRDPTLVLVADKYFPVDGSFPCAYHREHSSSGLTCVVRTVSDAIAGSSLLGRCTFFAVLPAGHFSLREELSREHALGADKFKLKSIARQLVESVRHLHAHRIAHGDIHPGHFVFIKDRYALVDLQACASFGNPRPGPRDCYLSATHSPPELLPFLHEDVGSVESCAAHDVWSLGATLLEVFTGRPLYSSSLQKRSDEWEKSRVREVEDPIARQLLSTMLDSRLNERPTMDHVYWHEFFN